MVELTCNPEAPSASFNLEASIEAKEVNEIYLKAERDNGKFRFVSWRLISVRCQWLKTYLDMIVTQVEQDIREACKNNEASFAVKNGT